MLRPLGDGFRGLARNHGLVLVVLASNLALALVLAVPFAGMLRQDLAHTGSSSAMMYGFDYDWWARFDGQARGFAASFAPDLTGTGFALRNLDLLLRGALPGGLFSGGSGADGTILGLGALYWLLQVFLTGGLVSVFRAPSGGWTFRGLVHASGFYFGRLLRVSLLALAAAGLVFAGLRPARALDGRPRPRGRLRAHGARAAARPRGAAARRARRRAHGRRRMPK